MEDRPSEDETAVAADAAARTATSSFGVGKREGHDASAFYARFHPPTISDDDTVARPAELIERLGAGAAFCASSTEMADLPDNSVALVVTSPPYFVGKDYELEISEGIPATYLDYLQMLRDVFAECARVLEPGGRIAVNVANLGRKPYRSLSADVIAILQDDLGLLLRGEVIWEKAATSSGSCAWGSFGKASNPVLRDMTERVIIASKGRFQRALSAGERQRRGLPHRSTMTNDEFVDVTRDVWRIDAESATRIGHPAPFPVDLPRRLIELYTYVDDLVLDPFAGSGSTLVAAARTGRIGVGYDLDPAYVALCEQRMGEELERLERVGAGDDLSVDERHDVHLAEAVEVGAKVLDIATRRLEAAGFTVDTKKKSVKHPGGVVVFDAVATAADGRRFFIDVAGAFTTVKPGVQRIEAAWRLVGRLAAAAAAPADPVLVLTPALPKRNTEAWKALQSLGPEAAFDMIELMDPAGLDRLAAYGNSALDPLPGFWSTERLS